MPTRSLLRNTCGNASIEYALLAAFLGLGLLSGLKNLRNGLGTNYDKISLQIQRVNNDTSGTKKETSRDTPFTYFSNGIQIDQIWIRYDDGSSALYRTSPTPAADFSFVLYDFGTDGVNKGAFVQRKNGSTYTDTYEIVRPNVTSVTYREGSAVATYLSEGRFVGDGVVVVHQTMISNTDPGTWTEHWYAVYNGPDANGQYVENVLGSTVTYPGQTNYNGQDISKYIARY